MPDLCIFTSARTIVRRCASADPADALRGRRSVVPYYICTPQSLPCVYCSKNRIFFYILPYVFLLFSISSTCKLFFPRSARESPQIVRRFLYRFAYWFITMHRFPGHGSVHFTMSNFQRLGFRVFKIFAFFLVFAAILLFLLRFGYKIGHTKKLPPYGGSFFTPRSGRP